MDLIRKSIGSITITDEDSRIVEGYFTDDKVDYYGHIVAKSATIEALSDYEKWGNIRDMHEEPVAKVIEIGKQSWNHVKVMVHDDETWKKIKAGIYKGFSVGINPLDWDYVSVEYLKENNPEIFSGLPGKFLEVLDRIGEVLYITSYILAEISIVDRPANPRAMIVSYKGKGIDSGLIHPRITEYYIGENDMDKEMEIQEDAQAEIAEVEAEEVDLETTEEKEVETRDSEGLDLVIDAMESLVKSFDEYADRIDKTIGEFSERVENMEKRLEGMESFSEEKEAEVEDTVVEEDDVDVEPKDAPNQLQTILDRLDTLTKNLQAANDTNRLGVNAGEDGADEKPEGKKSVSYMDMASMITGVDLG